MRLRQIEVFHAIVQAGSISGAARLLHVSQPNVSRVLNHTEQQLGFALFERRPRGMTVTTEGQQLLPEIEILYQHLQTINHLTRYLRKDKAESIRLGAAHACAQQIVVPAMVEFQKRTSPVHIDLVTEHFATLCEAVLNNELDIALVFGQHVSAELLAEPLFQSQMVALLPKEMDHPPQVSLSWLCQHNLLLMHPHDPLGKVIHRLLAIYNVNAENSLFIKTYSVIADMVVSGGGVGIVDSFTALRYQQQLQVVPIVEPLPFELMLISRRENPQSRAVQELKSLFKQRCWLVTRESDIGHRGTIFTADVS